ncbi:hypothetical protein DRO53_00315 [Candidatus Bathyarchaeota archaeon]|nr:MAG: hypothetical protein DRO46_01360 [Candidatus Hecatellales archaeon]RLI35770.1 MAG: hypothetical protein DRO53_00315 [Candidatus Bathyarchaeota archaeon]
MAGSPVENFSYLEVGKLRVRYLVRGEGKPVILVHGLGGSIESWGANIDALASHFKVYVFDLPGFGFSDKPRIQYRIGFFTSFLHDFMETLKIERASLVGNSLGGLISLCFTCDYPSKVEKLVVECSAGLETGARETIMRFMGEWWTMESLKSFYEFVYGEPSKVKEEILRLRLRILSHPDAKYAYKSILNMPYEWADLPEKLRKLKNPTLIVWGEKDRLIPVEYAYKLHSLLANSKLLIFKDAGHVPHAEKAEEYNREVAKFLLEDP